MSMMILAWIPVGVSAVLGAVWLVFGEARPAIKLSGILLFAVAVWLQFVSPWSLAGLLLQTALAFALGLWRRAEAAAP